MLGIGELLLASSLWCLLLGLWLCCLRFLCRLLCFCFRLVIAFPNLLMRRGLCSFGSSRFLFGLLLILLRRFVSFFVEIMFFGLGVRLVL